MTAGVAAGGRVLVTGAAGRIGSAVVRRLVRAGHPVTGLSLEYPHPTGADTELVGDVTSPADVERALEGVQAVVHLAAIIGPDLGDPHRVFTVNTGSTFAVLAAAAQRGVGRAVIASSINAVGNIYNPHVDALPYLPLDEDAPADVGDWYSLSKQCDELSARMVWRRWGTTVMALRFPMVATREQLRARVDAVRADPAVGAIEGWSYLDLDDAADAVIAALTADVVPGAHATLLAADDTLLTIDTETALDRYAAQVPRRRRFVGNETVIDTTRARETFGFAPTRSVHDQGYFTDLAI